MIIRVDNDALANIGIVQDITSQIIPSANISISGGTALRIGNLVVINLLFKSTVSMNPTTNPLKGFPKPKGDCATATVSIWSTGQTCYPALIGSYGDSCVIHYNGQIVANYSHLVSSVYLCED